MKRDIKFRYVWKYESSVAIGVYNMDEIDGGTPVAPVTKRVKWELISRDEYTGIKDKKGSEIYEGDILHDSNFVEDCNHVVDMIGDLGCWFMVDTKEGYANELHEYRLSSEVIGNVHQNPELIN